MLTIDAMYDESRILVDGHRGWMTKYPQNTLLSFEKAFDLGVDMVEFDVNLTADGVPVIIHNNTVDATTDHTGPTRAYTLKEIKAMDAACRFEGEGDFAGKGITIPTLEELLERPIPGMCCLIARSRTTRWTSWMRHCGSSRASRASWIA